MQPPYLPYSLHYTLYTDNIEFLFLWTFSPEHYGSQSASTTVVRHHEDPGCRITDSTVAALAGSKQSRRLLGQFDLKIELILALLGPCLVPFVQNHNFCLFGKTLRWQMTSSKKIRNCLQALGVILRPGWGCSCFSKFYTRHIIIKPHKHADFFHLKEDYDLHSPESTQKDIETCATEATDSQSAIILHLLLQCKLGRAQNTT